MLTKFAAALVVATAYASERGYGYAPRGYGYKRNLSPQRAIRKTAPGPGPVRRETYGGYQKLGHQRKVGGYGAPYQSRGIGSPTASYKRQQAYRGYG